MGNSAPIMRGSGSVETNQVELARTRFFATGSLLAALGVSSCCVLPVLFMSVGLGGAWLSNLFALSAYQPIFIILALAFLGAGFYHAYHKPKVSCESDSSCGTSPSSRVVKSMLWGATGLVIAGIIFPYVGQYLLEI